MINRGINILQILMLFCLAHLNHSSAIIAQQIPSMERSDTQGLVRGVIVDEYGTIIPDATIMITTIFRPVTEYSTVSDLSGRFECILPAGSYRLIVRKVIGNAYHAAYLWQNFRVSGGDTSSVVVDARRGLHLDITQVRFNGGDPFIEVSEGATFEIEFDYHLWAPLPVPQSDEHLVVGIDGVGQEIEIIGKPGTYPGMTDHSRMKLTAPDTSGLYSVNIRVIPYSDANRDSLLILYSRTILADSEYRIPLGLIRVPPQMHP